MSKSDKMNLGLLPKLRFPEFVDSGEWKLTTLNILADRVITRNNDSSVNRVLTNSAVDGVVDQSDYFDREIANKNNLDNYFIINKNDYVYNPRISVTAPVGPISKNKIGTGVMSPLYTVFRFKNTNSNFYEQYFKTSHWHDYLKSVSNTGARHDRISISNDTFMNMPLPCLTDNEQEKISDCLSSLDDIISLEDKKHTSLKEHKKGLMQKLFPAEGKTVPELRFKEFQNSPNWETKKLGEICEIGSSKRVHASDWKTEGIPFYRARDLVAFQKKGNIEKLYISPKLYEKNIALSGEIKEGHLLVTGVGTIGVSYLVKKNDKFYFKDGNIIWLKNENEKVLSSFLSLLYNHEDMQKQIKTMASIGTVATYTISNANQTIISFPSVPEQEKIAECLSSLDDLISAQAEKIITLKIHKKYLMQNLFPAISEVN